MSKKGISHFAKNHLVKNCKVDVKNKWWSGKARFVRF